jgi:hypothetical protein
MTRRFISLGLPQGDDKISMISVRNVNGRNQLRNFGCKKDNIKLYLRVTGLSNVYMRCVSLEREVQ